MAMAGRGTLAMQRLAVRLIEQRDPHDAIVLGDAIQEKGLEGFITGRSRPVMIRVVSTAHSETYTRVTTRDEQNVIARTRTEDPTFFVQGYEAIFNVGRFAAAPTDERWDDIWTMWFTPQRSTYRALVEAQLLPRTIRWSQIQWGSVVHLPADVALAHELYLHRVPPRRKKPIDAYMFSVVRRDEDNPRTWEHHFYEQRQ